MVPNVSVLRMDKEWISFYIKNGMDKWLKISCVILERILNRECKYIFLTLTT